MPNSWGNNLFRLLSNLVDDPKMTGCLLDSRKDATATRENQRPGPTRQGPSERDGAQAAGSRKRPTGPHNNKKVVVLGSMLGPLALFNTGYRHGANGDGKEPRSVPVLRLTFCFAALVVLHESTVRYILSLDPMVVFLHDSTLNLKMDLGYVGIVD
eukprot:scaffold49966_cov33-Attheya_sp.AAC.1